MTGYPPFPAPEPPEPTTAIQEADCVHPFDLPPARPMLTQPIPLHHSTIGWMLTAFLGVSALYLLALGGSYTVKLIVMMWK